MLMPRTRTGVSSQPNVMKLTTARTAMRIERAPRVAPEGDLPEPGHRCEYTRRAVRGSAVRRPFEYPVAVR